MALNLKDRIYTECITVGTGNIQMGKIKDGYQDWTVLNDGDDVYYCIVDDLAWEVGQGIYVKDDNEVTREKIFDSSTGAKLVLDGLSTVFATYPADKAVYLDVDGNIQLPEVNVRFKHSASEQVTSPVIATEAVIVDGTAGSGGSLAELLDVYKKDEVDNFLDTKANKSETDKSLEDLHDAVNGLDEVVGEIAPSFDKGVWLFDTSTIYPNNPTSGKFVLLDELSYTNSFEDVTGIIFSNEDYKNVTHTFNDVNVGNYMELVNSDGSFLLALVNEKVSLSGSVKFNVDVVSCSGTPRVGTSKVKFFALVDADLDLSSYMPKTGGTFTGTVDFNNTITLNNNFTQVRASVDKPFHTLKTNAPLNADGSQNTNEPFGLSIDLDNNNTFKNQFNIKNRKGEILYVKSGGNPYGKLDFDWTYTGEINKEHHIVNKEYVDNSVADLDSSINLHTLSNNKNTLKWIKADVPLTTLTFGSSNKAINVDNTFYLNRLYNNENSPVDVKDYEPTKDTIFEVWKGNELQVKTTIKFWQQSTFNFNHRRFNPSGNTPTIALTGDFNGSDYYSVILTNMKKVS